MVPLVRPLFLVRHSCTRSSPGYPTETSLGAWRRRSCNSQCWCSGARARLSGAVRPRAGGPGLYACAARVQHAKRARRAQRRRVMPGDAQRQCLVVLDGIAAVRGILARHLLGLVLQRAARERPRQQPPRGVQGIMRRHRALGVRCCASQASPTSAPSAPRCPHAAPLRDCGARRASAHAGGAERTPDTNRRSSGPSPERRRATAAVRSSHAASPLPRHHVRAATHPSRSRC